MHRETSERGQQHPPTYVFKRERHTVGCDITAIKFFLSSDHAMCCSSSSEHQENNNCSLSRFSDRRTVCRWSEFSEENRSERKEKRTGWNDRPVRRMPATRRMCYAFFLVAFFFGAAFLAAFFVAAFLTAFLTAAFFTAFFGAAFLTAFFVAAFFLATGNSSLPRVTFSWPPVRCYRAKRDK